MRTFTSISPQSEDKVIRDLQISIDSRNSQDSVRITFIQCKVSVSLWQTGRAFDRLMLWSTTGKLKPDRLYRVLGFTLHHPPTSSTAYVLHIALYNAFTWYGRRKSAATAVRLVLLFWTCRLISCRGAVGGERWRRWLTFRRLTSTIVDVPHR